MSESSSTLIHGGYDTTLNVIGGLRDCSAIYKVIDSYFSIDDSVRDLVSDRHELSLRTERSRIRVERAIRQSFLQFKNRDHKDLIQKFFQHNVSLPDRELILFWQFSLNNSLFRDISTQVFIKVYFSGRTRISKDDCTAYLKEFINHNKQLNIKWSESTINTLSTKYLNLMTKLRFLDGVRLKTFRHIKPSDESLILFIYFTKLLNPETNNILNNAMLPLCFVSPEDIRERFKKLSIKGFFHMNFNGVSLNIELIHSYKDICDVIYNRP